MKRILTVTLITIASLANGLAGDVKYKSYFELQEERERIADARYAQFRQEQDAKATSEKEAKAQQVTRERLNRKVERSQIRMANAGAEVKIPTFLVPR
jgi:hypothetical protein